MEASRGYYSLSSSVYGLLIEEETKVEGPCQSLSLRTDNLKENPIRVRYSSLGPPCSVAVSSSFLRVKDKNFLL